MKHFRDKKSSRLEGYNYSSEGAYFVTICTKNRERYFGEIRNGIMGLNEIGIVAHRFWQDISNHFEYAILDEFVIMPDHVHGIIFIDRNDSGTTRPVGGADLRRLQDDRWGLEKTKTALSKIIHGFKSSVTRTINSGNFDLFFAWQKSYHDRIIRNQDELDRIRNYIKNNPRNWNANLENLSQIP